MLLNKGTMSCNVNFVKLQLCHDWDILINCNIVQLYSVIILKLLYIGSSDE